MYKKFIIMVANNEGKLEEQHLIVSDEIQYDALKSVGFAYKCDVKRHDDGSFTEIELTKKK